jgi:drug/metabolite transporter (DMT)-like permease
VYIIVGAGVLRRVSAVQSSTVIFASAGLVYATLALLGGPHLPASGEGWLIIAAIVLIATVIPVGAFLAGLKRVGPTNASMLSTIEPVVTVLLAAALFKEALPALTLTGGMLILAAVLILARAELDTGTIRMKEPAA